MVVVVYVGFCNVCVHVHACPAADDSAREREREGKESP